MQDIKREQAHMSWSIQSKSFYTGNLGQSTVVSEIDFSIKIKEWELLISLVNIYEVFSSH